MTVLSRCCAARVPWRPAAIGHGDRAATYAAQQAAAADVEAHVAQAGLAAKLEAATTERARKAVTAHVATMVKKSKAAQTKAAAVAEATGMGAAASSCAVSPTDVLQLWWSNVEGAAVEVHKKLGRFMALGGGLISQLTQEVKVRVACLQSTRLCLKRPSCVLSACRTRRFWQRMNMVTWRQQNSW